MLIEIVGKFYDNHSLSIVNRNLALSLSSIANIQIIALDRPDPVYQLDEATISILRSLEDSQGVPNIQLRHSYPPLLAWPDNETTKVVFIQPWEFSKAPMEWQYKFETFADALIVPSHYVKKVFLSGGLNPAKLFVVPNGYDHTVFNTTTPVKNFLGINRDKLTFTFVGNTQWRKGLDILLSVWPQVFAKADKVQLIIKDNPDVYGKTNALSDIIRLQHTSQCAEIVYIDRNLSNQEIADLYKLTDILVHPYRAEGFGMHIQEAMACGAVPMVSDKGPTDDFVTTGIGFKIPVTQKLINIEDNNVFATKPGDSMTMMGAHSTIFEPSAEGLASLLYSVYHTHDRANFLSKLKAGYLVNTWDHVARQYLNVLSSINEIKTVQRYK